jgi:hypothetical protein
VLPLLPAPAGERPMPRPMTVIVTVLQTRTAWLSTLRLKVNE